MHKPVDLITSNSLFETLKEVAKLPSLIQEIAPKDQISEAAARRLLCTISHEADLSLVLKALGSIGAPATLDELDRRLTAMRERDAEQARPSA